MTQSLPTPSAPLTHPDRRPTEHWYQIFSLMWEAFNALTALQASDTEDLQSDVTDLEAADVALLAQIATLQAEIVALQGLTGSVAYDPPNILDGNGATTTVTVTGAQLGDFAQASFSLDLQNMQLTAYVSAPDTVSVRIQNETGSPAINLASGTLKARVTAA